MADNNQSAQPFRSPGIEIDPQRCGGRPVPLRPAAAPCVSCPYRCDAPSGIWDASEYDKLPLYDGETGAQSMALFLCHQRDGTLCAGWLACHDTRHLLALRVHHASVHPSAFGYVSPVPVFASGAEARAHGLARIDAPDWDALRAIDRLTRKAGARPK